MTISPTQTKLYERIKQVHSEMELKAKNENRDFDGRISEEELRSEEFGYGKVKKNTALAMAKNKLAHIDIIVKRVKATSANSYRVEYEGEVATEVSYAFRLLGKEDKFSVVECWYDNPNDSLGTKFIRKEGLFYVYKYR